MPRRLARLVAVAALSVFVLAPVAFAISDAELRCQSAIGNAGRAFTATWLDVLVACNNAAVAGETCGALHWDQVIRTAPDVLAQRIDAACRGAVLEHLGFPGACSDATGGSFDVDDLSVCLKVTHTTAAHDAHAVAYPQLQTFFGQDRRCQRELGRAARSFIASTMRARARCLDARLRGSLPETVDCLAEAPGTGDAQTDRMITQATDRLASRLGLACAGADLGHLGFPGSCPGPVSGDVTVDDVQSCIRTTHAGLVEEMIGAEYPVALDATPTPTPTPSPLPESLEIFPTSRTRTVGQIQNYTVAGHYSDGSLHNLTQRVSYASSDESVAVTTNDPANRGRVVAVGPGTALITATEPFSGVTSDAATLTVIGCAHDKCATGLALVSTCDPCVTAICAADPACCSVEWTAPCVAAVDSVCAASCPAAAAAAD